MKNQKTYSGSEALKMLEKGKILSIYTSSACYYKMTDGAFYMSPDALEWEELIVTLGHFACSKFTEYNEYNLSGKDAIQALIDGNTLISNVGYYYRYTNDYGFEAALCPHKGWGYVCINEAIKTEAFKIKK